jgi:hypothetical protein
LSPSHQLDRELARLGVSRARVAGVSGSNPAGKAARGGRNRRR